MQNLKVAARYAKGLILLAEEKQQSQLVYQEMEQIGQIARDSKDFRLFLVSPAIDNNKKYTIVKEIFKNFSTLSQQFIELLIKHKRADSLTACAKEYKTLYDRRNKIKEIDITTATPVEDSIIKKILSTVEKLIVSQQLRINKTVDASIIGGFIVKVGDQQIDNSVKHKLKTLKQEFSDNQYIPKF